MFNIAHVYSYFPSIIKISVGIYKAKISLQQECVCSLTGSQVQLSTAHDNYPGLVSHPVCTLKRQICN